MGVMGLMGVRVTRDRERERETLIMLARR